MNLPAALLAIGWMVRDTLRQSLASRLFWAEGRPCVTAFEEVGALGAVEARVGEGGAAIDSLVDEFALKHPGVLFVISAGNDGPAGSGPQPDRERGPGSGERPRPPSAAGTRCRAT